MGSKLRGMSRRQQNSYARDYKHLAKTAVEWIEANSHKPVIFSFIQEVALLGDLAALPPECIQNDGARELWQHCVERCPEATILMFQALVERVAKAAIEDGCGVSYDSDTVGRS
jgi:hypothetical protein